MDSPSTSALFARCCAAAANALLCCCRAVLPLPTPCDAELCCRCQLPALPLPNACIAQALHCRCGCAAAANALHCRCECRPLRCRRCAAAVNEAATALPPQCCQSLRIRRCAAAANALHCRRCAAYGLRCRRWPLRCRRRAKKKIYRETEVSHYN